MKRNATQAHALVGSSTRARAVKGTRICAVVGCTTKISMYNHAETCFLHTEPTATQARSKS